MQLYVIFMQNESLRLGGVHFFIAIFFFLLNHGHFDPSVSVILTVSHMHVAVLEVDVGKR